VKTLSAPTINIQKAQEPEYQNRHENSRIFHFIEVTKMKEAKISSKNKQSGCTQAQEASLQQEGKSGRVPGSLRSPPRHRYGCNVAGAGTNSPVLS